MSSALTTLGSDSYILRNAAEAATSSARMLAVLLPTWAKSRSSRILLMIGLLKSLFFSPRWRSQILRRPEILVAGRRLVGRIGDDLLEQEVHEQEQRFGLENQQDRFVVGIVVEVLVHASALHDHHVARLPVDPAAIVDVVAAPLEHVEHRAVEMAVLLPVGAGRIALDMGLDRLNDVGRSRRDDVLAVERGAALPRMIARGVDARLLQQLLVDLAVGPFERPHEDALLRPALPLAFLVLGRRLVVAGAGRGSFLKACHACKAPSWRSSPPPPTRKRRRQH